VKRTWHGSQVKLCGETSRTCALRRLFVATPASFRAVGTPCRCSFEAVRRASETPWTKKLWIYDLRTNKHFTLKTNPLKREDLDEFVQLYNPGFLSKNSTLAFTPWA
jgi:hypothetical protein